LRKLIPAPEPRSEAAEAEPPSGPAVPNDIGAAVYGALDLDLMPDATAPYAVSTVSLFVGADPASKLEPFEQGLRRACTGCGSAPEEVDTSNLDELLCKFGAEFVGAHCGGALLADNVVALPKHCVSGHALKDLHIVVGFASESDPEDWLVVGVHRLCYHPAARLALVELAEPVPQARGVPLAEPGALIHRASPWFARAVGHPLGLPNTHAGGNEHTQIARVAEHEVRATLDTFEHSSGSTVWISEKLGAGEEWLPFGLVEEGFGNTLRCKTAKVCQYEAEPPDPDPRHWSVIVTPLESAYAVRDEVSRGATLGGDWTCETTPGVLHAWRYVVTRVRPFLYSGG
jgi:hypothetical protein